MLGVGGVGKSRYDPLSAFRFPLCGQPISGVDPTMHNGGTPSTNRFMLWVDAVGGFLVCLSDEVTIGQPVSNGSVDVPLLADLSSGHARIRRDSEGYLLEAVRAARVDGQPVNNVAALTDHSRIRLGDTVRMMFRRPNALSATARLEFASPHRTQPTADAVVLMADNCILGPESSSHIVCRNWRHRVILFRHDQKLFCRSDAVFYVDGVQHRGRAEIHLNCRIEGEDFSLSLEPLD